jgi:exonuclease III
MDLKTSKSFLKVEGLTQGKHDIILVSDCRLKSREPDISRLMGLNKNASYKLYCNSNRDSRGVAVAIKRSVFHEVVDTFRTEDQNVILLKLKIKGNLIVIGTVYGPNENNAIFYTNLRAKLTEWNLPFIIGGDFNTILDPSVDDLNLDRVGPGGVPNHRNSQEIRKWILEGNCMEPFRAMYPEQREVSYIPFRVDRGGREQVGKTRLDFFLIDKELIDQVKSVKYEDRLGYDFDHKMVTLIFGKKCNNNNIYIYADTLNHNMADILGKISVYDTLNNHTLPELRNDDLSLSIGRALMAINDYKNMELRLNNILNNNILPDILLNMKNELENLIRYWPSIDNMLNLNYTCNWRLFTIQVYLLSLSTR